MTERDVCLRHGHSGRAGGLTAHYEERTTMKIVSSRGVLAAAVLLSAAPAAATNGMRMIGFGPVQDSMGGASVGAPLDAATIVTNPAGMSSLERRVNLAGTWFNPTVKYKATDGYGMTSGNEQESDRAASLIPTFGVIVPVGDKLSLGLGVVGVSGMGVDYGADLFGSKTLTSFMNLRVAPAASYKSTIRSPSASRPTFSTRR